MVTFLIHFWYKLGCGNDEKTLCFMVFSRVSRKHIIYVRKGPFWTPRGGTGGQIIRVFPCILKGTMRFTPVFTVFQARACMLYVFPPSSALVRTASLPWRKRMMLFPTRHREHARTRPAFCLSLLCFHEGFARYSQCEYLASSALVRIAPRP